MPENKHTPGPWRYDVQNHQIRTGQPTERRFSGELISTVSPLNPEMIANGNLIAAAPDMLAALKASLVEHEALHEVMLLNPQMRGIQPPAIIAIIRAAITKAGGAA